MTLAYEPSHRLDARIARGMTRAAVARPARVRMRKAILSVCFDDFPKSAAALGAAALERVGARGTFYACAGMMGEMSPAGKLFEADDLRRLGAAGHELGCHTYSHLDCARTKARAVISECALNAIELSLIGCGRPVRTMAYPFGETSAALKRALPADFTAARGAAPGLNYGRIDLAQLKAYPLYGWDAVKPLLAALEKARRIGAWMIVFTHDVAAEPSPWGAPTGALGQVLLKAREMKINILPVADAAARVLAEKS